MQMLPNPTTSEPSLADVQGTNIRAVYGSTYCKSRAWAVYEGHTYLLKIGLRILPCPTSAGVFPRACRSAREVEREELGVVSREMPMFHSDRLFEKYARSTRAIRLLNRSRLIFSRKGDAII
jgi:hypothetical protein